MPNTLTTKPRALTRLFARNGRAGAAPSPFRATQDSLLRCNPLLGLTARQAQNIYDAARGTGGDMPLLQRIYEEIEATDPTLLTCVNRRAAALSGMGWTVRPIAAAPAQNAERQQAAAERFLYGIENLDAAIEHLGLAFFRGFSFVQPLWQRRGIEVHTVGLLPSWAFARNEAGDWVFRDADGLDQSIEGAQLIGLHRARAIDYPALFIYLRASLAERDWGRFLERYGIPPVDAIMSDAATEENREDYLAAAEAARDGLCAVWPAGSGVSRADTTRAGEPFSQFVRHQEEQIVLMATGGTLTSLAESGAGTLAGNAQMDVWREIVAHDAREIAGVLNRGLLRPFLRAMFPDEPPAVFFEMGRDAEPTASELLDLAVKAKSAGYTLSQDDLEEGTGYTFKSEAAAQGPGTPENGDFAAGAAAGEEAGAGTPLQFDSNPLQNARTGADGKIYAEGAPTPLRGVLGHFSPEAENGPETGEAEALCAGAREDLAAAGEEIRRALEAIARGDAQEVGRIAAHLPEALPASTHMADALASAMQRAFAGVAEGTVPNAYKNPKRCECGRFSGDSPRPCARCGRSKPKKDQVARARKMLDEVFRDHKYTSIEGVAYRPEIDAEIDLDTGYEETGEGEAKIPGKGIAKLYQKHDEDIPPLPEALIYGEMMPLFHYDNPDLDLMIHRRCIVYEDYCCFIQEKPNGHWFIDSFHRNPEDAARIRENAEIIKRNGLVPLLKKKGKALEAERRMERGFKKEARRKKLKQKNEAEK